MRDKEGTHEKIDETSYNCLEKNEQVFCLLCICHPVEIKAFQGDLSPTGKGLTAYRSLNFCSVFLLYSQQSDSTSSQPVENSTLVTDLWLRRIIILCKTHLYKKAEKQRVFQG